MAQPKECRQVRRMQTTDGDQREIGQLGLRLAKPQTAPASHVDEHSCLATDSNPSRD
jgi:hypothetical protein